MRGVKNLLITLVVLLSVVWAPERAAADGSRDRARELGEEGIRHYEAGRYDPAFDAFARANAEFPAPTFTLFMARCRSRQQRLIEARELYRAVQAGKRVPDEPEQFGRAREDAQRELLALQVRIPTLRIDAGKQRIEEARLNGKPHDPPALLAGMEVDPGSYELSVRIAGKDLVQKLEIGEGSRRVVEFSAPRAIHTRTSASREAPPAPSDRSVAPWIAFGAGAAGLIVGSVAGVLALRQANDVKADCEDQVCPTDREADGKRAERTALISTIGFAVAGVGVATGVVLLLAEPNASGPPAAQLRFRGTF